MSEQEFKDFVDQLKGQGLTDEDVLDIFYQAFVDGELSREDLDSAANAMGYHAKKEFLEDSKPEEGGDGGKGLDKDQIEAAKEFKEGESEEDFKERVDEGETADEDDEDDDDYEDVDDEDDDEDSERKEAMKYFD